MLEVIRSPARVSWHVMCNGQLLEPCDTKHEAEELASKLAYKYKLEYKGVSKCIRKN